MVVKPIRPRLTLFAVFSAAALFGRPKRRNFHLSGILPQPPGCPQEARYGPVAPSMPPAQEREEQEVNPHFPIPIGKQKHQTIRFPFQRRLIKTSQVEFLLHRVGQVFANRPTTKIRDPSHLFNP